MDRKFLFDFEPTHRVLLWTFQGRVTEQSYREGRTEVARLLPQLLPLRAAMLDFTDVQSVELSSDAIASLAQTPPVVPANLLILLVAPAQHMYGLARMFSILAEETRPNLHVFRTREEALALLDIADPHFEPASL